MTKLHESVHIENAVCHKVSAIASPSDPKFQLKLVFILLSTAYHLLSVQIVCDFDSIGERTESTGWTDQWLLEE